MPTHAPIQLDVAYQYQRAAASVVQRVFTMSHGKEFADSFVREHRHSIQNIAKTRLCGLSESVLIFEAYRLSRAYTDA